MNWQVTATTIYCDAIDEEVTLMVYHDWSLKCTGFRKYGKPTEETSKFLKKRSKLLKRSLMCSGEECTHQVDYRNKLMTEEAEVDI